MLFDQNFYFQHNNESADGIEYCARAMFPLLAVSKINYRTTLFKYWINKYRRYIFYLYMTIVSIILYLIKINLIVPLKKKNNIFK